MYKSKRFRAPVCLLMAVLFLVHSVPAMASGRTGSRSSEKSSSAAPASAPSATRETSLMSAGGGALDPGTRDSIKTASPSSLLFTGAATYQIPISVPPGRAGIAPNLALTYNSYRGNGWVGVGWDLDLGSIQRATKMGVDYSPASTDFVASIQGTTSELVPREDWGSRCYGAKIESAFSRFRYDPGGESWVVTDKAGTNYFYGSTSASRQENPFGTFKWLLDRVEDANGNFMTVSYVKDSAGGIYPDRIDYTGNGGLDPSNYVKFTIEDRGNGDVSSSYISNFKVTIKSRLSKVEVYGSGQLAGYYVLGYSPSPTTSRSRLTSVTTYGSDGTSLPPMKFEWKAGNIGSEQDRNWGSRSGGDTLVNYQLLDLDGDGRADVIYDEIHTTSGFGGVVSETIFRVLKSTGTGFTLDTPWGTGTAGYNSSVKIYQLADINRDGLPDIIYIDPANAVHVLFNSGSTFPNDIKTNGVAPHSANTLFKMADFNGDGIPDLIYDNNSTFHVLFSRGDGSFTEGPAAARAPLGVSPSMPDFQVADMNGDGLADVVYEDRAGEIHVLLSAGECFQNDQVFGSRALPYDNYVHPELIPPFRLADVNGDGLIDFIYNGFNMAAWRSEFRVLLNKGNGFTSDQYWGTKQLDYWSNPCGGWSSFQMADVNGDGLVDLVYNSKQCLNSECSQWEYPGIKVLLSTGSGFMAEQTWGEEVIPPQTWGFRLADVDGDGIPDFVYESSNNNGYNCFGSPGYNVVKAKGPYPDLLTTVNNGIGGSYTIDYQPSRGLAGTKLPYIIQTVSSITVRDGNSNESQTRYEYSGGIHDPVEREFRGFKYVKQILPSSATVETYFHQDDIKKGLVEYQLIRKADGSAYRKIQNTYDEPATGTSGAHFPRLIQADDNNYEGDESHPLTVTTTFDYDAYGNIWKKYQHGVFNVLGDERCDFAEFDYDTTHWLLARPSHTRTRSDENASEDLARTDFVYKPGTNLISSKTFWLKEKGPGDIDPTIYYTYDPYGNLETQTDPNGNLPTFITYDPTFTFPATITNPKGHVTRVPDYDYRFGKPLQREDSNGKITSYTYDGFGRPSVIVGPAPDFPTITYTYANFGTVGQQYVASSATKTNGSQELYVKTSYFDGLGRDYSTSSGQTSVQTKYNRDGKVWKKSLPYFSGITPQYWIEYTYDSLGRLERKVNPDGATQTFTYSRNTTIYRDPNNNDPANPKTSPRTEQRDVYGRVVKITECLTGTQCFDTAYDYDTLGNLVAVTDAHGKQTLIGYDSLSRKVEISDPAMGHWSYHYDPNGNLDEQTDAKGNTIVFRYDELNRPLSKEYPPGQEPVFYEYDEPEFANSVGRLTTVTDASGVSNFSYDYAGRVSTSSVRVDIDGTPNTFTFSSAHNHLGLRTSIRYQGSVDYPDDETVSYTYDPDLNLSGVTGYASFSGFNAAGQPGNINFQNTAGTSFTWYPENCRLKTLSTTLPRDGRVQNFLYQYDANGNIRYLIDQDISAKTQEFIYDGLNRLTSASSASYQEVSIDYAPDEVGNIKPEPAPATGLTSRLGQVLTYDYDNRVTSISMQGVTTSFVYDAQGARVKKISGSSTTTYIGKLYEIKDGALTKHIFAGGRRIATKTPSGTYFYHPDHLGSLNFASDAAGYKTQEVTYYPFGGVRTNAVQPGKADLAYKFTGQELDNETGLYYYGARYYDAAQGRFISADSIVPSPGNPQSLNRYAYCLNNPINAIDPSGHFSLRSFFSSLFGGIIGGFTFALTGNPIFAGMAAGGASGALSGSAQNMMMGALMGGATGALGSVVQANFGTIGTLAMVGVGAGSAVSKGGWSSLAYMGAGMVGGAIGYQAGSSLRSRAGAYAFGHVESDSQPLSEDNGAPVPEHLKQYLQRFKQDISYAKLNEIRIYDGLPQGIGLDNGDTLGYTAGDHIYLISGTDLRTANGVALFAHEVFHSSDMRRLGWMQFAIEYLSERHAYLDANPGGDWAHNIALEIPAYAFQDKVFYDLMTNPPAWLKR